MYDFQGIITLIYTNIKSIMKLNTMSNWNKMNQIMDNTNTPSIFLQLMKAIYTGDEEAFEIQRKALHENLRKTDPEVANHYQRLTGLLATGFMELFLATTETIDEEEVKKMAITIKDLLNKV